MIHQHLKDISPEHHFRLKGGKNLRNLYELAAELKAMGDDVFKHRVTGEKNDFYNWVHHIIKDRELSREISGIKDRKKMAAAVESRIKTLEKAGELCACELRKSLRCGAREFCIGLAVGIAVGIMVVKALAALG